MSRIPIDWIAFFLFVFLFIGVVIAERRWLVRKGWAASGRATGYVLVTDLLGFCLGSFVVFVMVFFIFMMVMGPAGTGSTSPEYAYWITLLVGFLLPLVILIMAKRIFLLVFNIRSGKDAWIYSVLSSFVIILAVLVPPPLFYFLSAYLLTWK